MADERLEWLRDYGVDPDKLDEHSAAKTRLVMPAVCPSCRSTETRGRYHRGGWREYTCLDCGSEFKNRDSRIAHETDDGEHVHDPFDGESVEVCPGSEGASPQRGPKPVHQALADLSDQRSYELHLKMSDPELLHTDDDFRANVLDIREGPMEPGDQKSKAGEWHGGGSAMGEGSHDYFRDEYVGYPSVEDADAAADRATGHPGVAEVHKLYPHLIPAGGHCDAHEPRCPKCNDYWDFTNSNEYNARDDEYQSLSEHGASEEVMDQAAKRLDATPRWGCKTCGVSFDRPKYPSDKDAHLGDDLGFHDQRDQWEQHLDTERAPDTSKIRDCASCGEPWGFVLSPSLGVYVRRHLDERESDHPLSKGHRPIEEHEIIRGIEAHVSDDKAMHHANPEQLRTDHPYWDKCGTCGGDGIQVGSTDVLTGEQKQSPCKDCGGIGEAYDAEYWDSDDQLHDFSNYPNFHQMKIPDKSLKTHLKDVHQTDKGYDDAYVQHQMTHGINVDPAIAEILMPKAAAKTAEFDRTKYDEVQHVDPRWIVKNVKPVDDPTWKQNFNWLDTEGKSHWKDFLDDVKTNGVTQPIHTKNQMDGGGLEMANGHHRVWGAIRTGRASVPVVHHDEWIQVGDRDDELATHTTCRDYQNSKEASKTAVNRTRSWYLKQRDALVDQVGPDKSDTVHEFGDGWTIKHLNTVGDARYEGTLMKNCIKDIGKHPCEDCNPYGVHDHGTCECLTCEGTGHTYDPPHTYIGDALRDGDSEDAFEMDHRLTDDNHIGRIYSLRDPDNIPQVSFTMHDKEDYDIDEKKGFGIENLNGRTNRAPKPEHAMKVVQFFKDATKDEPGYHTIEDGSIDHAIHVFGQHNSPSATVSERRGCRECIDKHNSEHIPTWNHSEKSRPDDPNCPECREPRLFAGSKTAEFTPGDTTYPFAETQTPNIAPQPRGLDPWKDRGDNGVPLHNDMVFDPKLKKWINPEMSAMPAEVNYPGNGLMSQSSTENETSWHLTDNPKFALNPDYSPENNTTLGGDYPHKGIFLGTPEHWLNRYDYVRPFVAEISHPPVEGIGGWGGEKFLPADQFDKATVERVIPLDEYAHETYHAPGWIEESHGEHPDIPSDYRYTGPDVRDMSKGEVNHHLRRTNEYIKSDRPQLLICKDCAYPKSEHHDDGWAWKDFGKHPFKSPGPLYQMTTKKGQTWTQSVDAPPNGGNVKRLPYDPYPEGKGETHTLDVLPAPTGEDVKKWKTVKTFPGDKSFADHPQSQDRIDNMPQVVGREKQAMDGYPSEDALAKIAHSHEPEGPHYDEDDDPNGMKTAGFEWIKEFKVVGGDWSPEIYCPKCGSDRTEATGDHETIGDDEIPEIVREERECHDCGRYFQWNMEGHHEGKPYLKGPGGTRIEGKTALLDYDPVRDVQPSSNSAPAPDATKPVGDPWPNQVHDGVNPDRPGYIFDKKLKKFIRDEQLTYPDVGPTFPGVTDINKVGMPRINDPGASVYHAAPSRLRDVIQNEGVIHGSDTRRYDWAPKGTYVWETEAQARNYALGEAGGYDEPFDVWEASPGEHNYTLDDSVGWGGLRTKHDAKLPVVRLIHTYHPKDANEDAMEEHDMAVEAEDQPAHSLWADHFSSTDINKVGQAHPQPVGMHEGDNGIDDPMKHGDPSQVKKIIPGTQKTVPETNVWNVSIDNLNKTGAPEWPGLDKLKRPWAEDRGYEAYDPWLMGGGCAHLALAMKAAWPEGKIAAAWYDDHGRRALSHAAFYDPKSGHAWDGTGAHKRADIAVSTHPGSDIEMDADPHKVAEHMGIDFSDEAPFADDGIADAWNTVDEHFMPASARTCRECGELGVHDTERGLCKDCAKTKEAATSNAARTKTDWVAADVPGPEEYPKCQLCGTNDPEQHSEDNEGAHVQDPGWQAGDRPFYTYRCYEGEDSADAPLWHRSNQHVTVTHRVPNDEVDDLANGGPMYHIKFDDGHEGSAWTDELLLPRLSVNKTGSDDPLNLGGWKPPKPKGEFVSVVKKPGGGAATIHVVGCPAVKDKVERGGFRDVTEEDIHWAIEYREKWNDGDTVHSCVKKRLKLGQAQQAADVDGEREPEEPKLTDRQLHVVKNHPMMAEEIASIEELTAFADPELQQLHLQDHALRQHDHNPEVLRVAKRSS